MQPKTIVSKRFDSVQEGDHSVGIHNFNGKASKVSKSEAHALLDRVSTLQSVYRGTTLVARKESENPKIGKNAKAASSSTQAAKASTSFFSNSLQAVRNLGRYFRRQPVHTESEKPVELKRSSQALDFAVDLDVDVNQFVNDQSEIVTPRASIDSDNDETVEGLSDKETDLARAVSDSDSDDEKVVANQLQIDHFMLLRNGKEVHYRPELAKKYVYFAPAFYSCKYEVISTK